MHLTTETTRKEAWFETWFDSPYYHILYDHRDETEAATFIHQLKKKLSWKAGETALDLACGKGRHSVMIAKEGLDVTGLDLSPQNIQAAQKKYGSDSLHFDIHDMRKVYKSDTFDYVFNLFTSFGYFEDRAENLSVIQSATKSLKTGGKLIIDFLNVIPIIKQFPQKQTIQKGEYIFHVQKELKNGMIRKNIAFTERPETMQIFLVHFLSRISILN